MTAAAVPALELGIVVDDVLSEEYLDPDTEDTSSLLTRYIESKSGSKWGIQYTTDPGALEPGIHLCADLKCDGTRVRKIHLYNPTKDKRDGKAPRVYDRLHYEERGQFYALPLKFKDVQKSEELPTDEQMPHLVRYAQTGIIEIVLWRAKAGPRRMKPKYRKPSIADEIIPEKALKGRDISQIVGFGTATPAVCRIGTKLERLGDEPLATYRFKYASRECLEALMIIPHSEGASRNEDGREDDVSSDEDEEPDVDAMTEEQLRERMKAMLAREAEQKRKIKEEEMKAPKREAEDDELAFTGVRPVKKARLDSGQSFNLADDPIDLTSDD